MPPQSIPLAPSAHRLTCEPAGGSRCFFRLHLKSCPVSPPDPNWQDTSFPATEPSMTSWRGTGHVRSRALITPTAWAKLPQLCGAAPHSPHFIELELVGRVGCFPPVISWIEAVEEGVWGEQVTGRRREEINQQQPGLHISLGQPLTGSKPREGDYKCHEMHLKTRMAFSSFHSERRSVSLWL